MKLTNSVMWESIQVLSNTKETGKLGYACARNLRKLMGECREYMEIRDKLLAKYGTPDGTGRYNFDPEKAKEFSKEIVDYASIEHNVDVMQVDEDTFCSGNLTTKEMFTLEWMVKGEEDVSERDA